MRSMCSRPTLASACLAACIAVLVLAPILWVWPARGITSLYYFTPDWGGKEIRRVEPRIDLSSVETDQDTYAQRGFSLTWGGWLRIDRAGTYGFSTRSDDGSSVHIDGRQIVENGGYHAMRSRSGTVELEPGFHLIRVFYLQNAGAYGLEVSWTEPGGEESPIPAERLYVEEPTLPGLALLARNVGWAWRLAWLGLLTVLFWRVTTRIRAMSATRRRRLVLQVGVVAGSVVFTLVLAELAIRIGGAVLEDRRDLRLQLEASRDTELGGARTFGLAGIVQPSDHEGIVYELKPNLRGVFLEQPFAVNSRGLRDYEYSYRKDEGVFRIVGLGDSSLFGWGVAMEDGSMKVLERLLNDASSTTRFEVLNFAVPGYNTAIEADVFIEKALAYDPDVALVNFNTNDYDVPGFMKLPKDYATLRTSYLVDFLYSRYEAFSGAHERRVPAFDFSNRTLTLQEADRLDEDPALPDEYRHMVGVKGFERALDRLVGAAGANDVEVIVFDVRGYPGLHATYEPDPFRDSQRQTLERLSVEKGFRWLNTYPSYAQYMNEHPDAPLPSAFWVSETDSHPSALAHQINAQALFDYLVAEGIVPISASSRR